MSELIPEDDKDVALVDERIQALFERFDTVQVMVTRYDQDGGTDMLSLCRGKGNFYARLGQVTSWLTKVDEDDRIERRKDNDQD